MIKPALIIIAGIAVLAAASAAIFVESGLYNIGADEHHWNITLRVIEQLRDRSIAARAHSVEPLLVIDPNGIKVGARRYAALCVGCHIWRPAYSSRTSGQASILIRRIFPKKRFRILSALFGSSSTASR